MITHYGQTSNLCYHLGVIRLHRPLPEEKMAHVPLSEQIYRHRSLLADDRIVTSDCPAMLFGRDTHAENAFSRYKRTFGDGLRAKRDKAQEREASMASQLLNRMQELGRPLSYPVR